ncbi:hypothetical protein [Frankia sp. Cj5]|uniref:hypothetical protein n=1 Tax=Frankia sp. Cj5 TaxID=2880978 RepID=UPI001EF42FD2|nr:hypothetical protein [Frankia sp. Cj5]
MADRRRFSPGVRILAAAGLVTAGIAVGLLLGSRGGSPAPSPTAGTAGVAPAASGPVAPDPGLPTLDFSDLTWMDFHGFALPVSPTAGPHILADDRASGFAHTPLGAALAAINIGFRTGSSVSPFVFEPTIAEQVTGVDQPALVAQTRTDAANEGVPARLMGRLPEPVFRFVGVRFDAVTPDRLVLYVATAAEDTTGTTVYAAGRADVRWERGDWRVVAPPGGSWTTVTTRIASSAGFQLFPRR